MKAQTALTEQYDIRIYSRYDIVSPPIPSWLAGQDVGRIAASLRKIMGFRRRESPNDVFVGHIGVTDTAADERSELFLYESARTRARFTQAPTRTKAQTALIKMAYRETELKAERYNSCCCLALAEWGASKWSEHLYGVEAETRDERQDIYRRLTEAMYLDRHHRKDPTCAFGNREGKLFGLLTDKIDLWYGRAGLARSAALIDGKRFPRNCILHLLNKKTGGKHAVCRKNGILIDTSDCRDEPWKIIGFWK